MMRAHTIYWSGLMDRGKMLILGPVADPKGGWGMGVLKVSSEEELHELESRDPAILGNRGLYYENLADATGDLSSALSPKQASNR